MADQPNLNQTRKDIMDIAAMTEETFRSVAANIQDAFRNALEAGSNVSKTLGNDISNNLKNIARQSSDVINNQDKLNKGTLKQSEIQKQIQARTEKINAIENQIRVAKLAGIDVGKDILEDLQATININNTYINQLKEQKDLLDQVDKEIGLLGSGIKGLGSFLGKLGFGGLAKPLEEAIENSKAYKIQLIQAQKEYDNLINKNSELTEEEKKRKEELQSEIKTLSLKQSRLKNIGSSLKEQFTLTNIMDFTAMELVKSFIQLDQLAGDTAKSMGISYSEATKLNSEFNSIANESGNIFVTTKGINESYNQINQALGTNGQISKDLLVTQTKLVKQAFYSVEAATMLSKLSLATGKPAEEITTQFLGQVKALNLVNKTAINEKALLESISKVSKATLATFANQPGKLAEAAYEAKRLGLELDQLEGIQNSLLDIESSIASEFEAEVLTGKQLNLERARYYALTNDLAGLSKELAAQGITQAKFAGMNVIQQEAVAKAMGMSREAMGGMLLEQEAISKLSQGDTEENRKKLAMLKERGFSMQAIAELGQEEFDRQLQSASIQDKFNASVEKLKEIFVGLVDPLLPVLDIFSNILSIVGLITKPIGAIFNYLSGWGSLWGGIAKALIAAGMGAFLLTTSLTGGLAAAGILAAIGGGMALYEHFSQAGDISSPANGKTQVSTREGGLFELSKNDDLVAAPGLINKLNSKSQPIIITQPSQPVQQAPQIDYDKMALAMSRVKVQTNLDGVRVSSELQKAPMGIATRKI